MSWGYVGATTADCGRNRPAPRGRALRRIPPSGRQDLPAEHQDADPCAGKDHRAQRDGGKVCPHHHTMGDAQRKKGQRRPLRPRHILEARPRCNSAQCRGAVPGCRCKWGPPSRDGQSRPAFDGFVGRTGQCEVLAQSRWGRANPGRPRLRCRVPARLTKSRSGPKAPSGWSGLQAPAGRRGQSRTPRCRRSPGPRPEPVRR